MASPRATGLAAALLALACTTPASHAATTVGFVSGTGANAGEALSVDGDRRANDITITLSRVRSATQTRTRFQVVDRRSRVRTGKQSQRGGCRVRGRHTVICASSPTSFAYVHLGAGSDRLTVRTPARPRPVSVPVTPAPAPAPDGLAEFPSDEGSEGSFLGWIIDGGAGDDRIVGSPYFDHITGGPGSDVLHGRAGDDLFEQRGEPGEDRIFGGSGHDALQWGATTGLRIDLTSGTFDGGSVRSIDKVRGGAGDDVLIGSDRPEMLQGAGGADAIAGLGGADLLVGDGVFTTSPAADRIDGGPGDDLVDISNRAYQPYGPSVARSAPGPADAVVCGAGNDRVDTTSAQIVPADCEGARFNDAATTVALRPATRADGALVFDVPCPAQNFYPRAIGTCDGTLVLIDPVDRRVVGSAAFSARGGARAAVAVKALSPLAAGPVGVQIAGAFDHAMAGDDVNRFDFGWATAF